jgi:hypothetical protein
MSSWRDHAPREVQAELDALVSAAFEAAGEFLVQQRGELHPFGMAVAADGTTEVLGADPGLGERPPPEAVMDLLLEGAVKRRDELRAVALVADVRLQDSDAVLVRAEHRDSGPGLHILARYDYKGGRLRRRLTYLNLSASEAERQVWA